MNGAAGFERADGRHTMMPMQSTDTTTWKLDGIHDDSERDDGIEVVYVPIPPQQDPHLGGDDGDDRQCPSDPFMHCGFYGRLAQTDLHTLRPLLPA
ncbi:hypothetical protein ACRE_017360 [Hapsidospora chrysogenum ATCC 11550]|uniref:Uncharacterized protein n=1 Tax=Hapsidospora chrysogenum (strain ATCC 11550 / CBS 779.69 / DSM 880 / IAM 14645 / JCM 23072 / IMI 49137) TaxID=857340 RepID=A0A086TDF9_HAPC1|nr:hypothetical protein ACRE_017360 [Hapsidospora chrysogenum ATCC 11550]